MSVNSDRTRLNMHTETEIYFEDGKKQDLPGFDDKYNNIVDYILKITDNIWEEKQIHVINQTYTNDVKIHTGAQIISGIQHVINGTIQTLNSFPDRQMDGEAVIWSEDGPGRFFSSHRIGSHATNLGSTSFGKSTEKKVFFRTIADCAVFENKIYEEWLVRDNLTIIEQLGFDPEEMAKLETKYDNNLNLIDTENSILQNTNGTKKYSQTDKRVIDFIHQTWNSNNLTTTEEFYDENAIIHTIQNKSLKPKDYTEFIDGLKSCFSNVNIEVCRVTTNVRTDDSEVAVRWKIKAIHNQDGFFGAASQKPIFFYGVSHLIIKNELIVEEYSIFDAYDILCQIHANNGSSKKKVSNIKNNDRTTIEINNNNKIFIHSFFNALNDCLVNNNIKDALSAYCRQDLNTVCSDPLGQFDGLNSLSNQYWNELIYSFPDLEIQPYIIISGIDKGKECVSVAGNMIGTFEKDWISIPANQQPIYLRFSAQFIIVDGQISKQWIYMDILSVIKQAGFSLFDEKGVDQPASIPMTHNGMCKKISDPDETQLSFDLVNSMINGLLEFDGVNISSMNMKKYWDVKKMMWYGPSPIGSMRSLKGFEKYHQIPFLKAFPNRGVDESPSNVEYINFGDGHYVCHFGHELMYGKHTGDGWLDLKATDNNFRMSVQDFWRRDGGRLVENWVMLDMVNVLSQLGVDVFELLENKKRKQVHERQSQV